MSKEEDSPAMSEEGILDYITKSILPRYQQIFNDKFNSASFLIKLLEKNLLENSKNPNVEERMKVHEVITKFMKNFGMFTSSLDEDSKKHAASLLYYVRSQIHKKQKNYVQCVEDLGLSIKLYVDFQYYRQRGLIYMNILKKYNEAFQDFTVVHEAAKEKKDINGQLHTVFNISRCLLEMSETEKCLMIVNDNLSKVFHFSPKNETEGRSPMEEEDEGEDTEIEEESDKSSLKENYEAWNQVLKVASDNFWGYFSIFLLLRADCYLRMNMFEKTKKEWNFIMENYIHFFRDSNVVGNMCFCRDLDRKFEEFPTYRLFFMEYILNLTTLQPNGTQSPKKLTKKGRTAKRNKNVGLLRKIDPAKTHFPDSEISKIRKRLEYEEEMEEKRRKKAAKDQAADDPYAITKQLLLLKNAMPDNAMGGADLPLRMMNVLSQVALEDLTWTNPTLKYWSCNVLDFKEPMIISNRSQSQTSSRASGVFSQKGFYDPGRGRSILPLDNYRYMPLPAVGKVREVFHVHPSTDPSLRSFLEQFIHLRSHPRTQFGGRKDEIVYLAQHVMKAMQGNVHEMMKSYRYEINKLQEKYKTLHKCDLLLILCHGKLQRLITEKKKNLVLTFDDLVKHKVPGVCRHRAILFKLCCDLRNIPSRLVRGYLTFFDQTKKTKSQQPQRISHAWNLIKIEGKVYIVDLMNGSEILIDWCSTDAEIYRSHGGVIYSRSEVEGEAQPNQPFAEQINSVPLAVPLMFSPTDGFRNTLQSCDVSKPIWIKSSGFSKTSKLVSKTENVEELVIHKEINIKMINDFFGSGPSPEQNKMKLDYFHSQKRFLIRYLNHKNLVSGQYDSLHEGVYYLFFKYYQMNAKEYLDRITISSKKKRSGSQKVYERRTRVIEVLIFLVNVLKGLRFLHKNGMYHNNLKVSNILINFNKSHKIVKEGEEKNVELIREVKISDFFGINSFQTYLVLWNLLKQKTPGAQQRVKEYVIKNNLIHIPPEIVEFGLNKQKEKTNQEEEFRKLYFENEKFDIYSFGVLLKQFKDFLPPTMSSVCNTCVSRYRKSRPKICTILRKLEGSILKEFHKIGGVARIQKQRKLKVKNMRDEIMKTREIAFKLEEKNKKMGEEAIKEGNVMKGELEEKGREVVGLVERVKELEKVNGLLEERLLIKNSISTFSEGGATDDESSRKLNEIIEKRVTEKMEEETKSYGLAVRMYRDSLEEKFNKMKKTKEVEVEGLMKQIQSLLQNQKKKD